MISISSIVRKSLVVLKRSNAMNIKSFLYNLERALREKYPHITFEFFYSRRKRYVHMGLDKSLLFYTEHEKIVGDIEYE